MRDPVRVLCAISGGKMPARCCSLLLAAFTIAHWPSAAAARPDQCSGTTCEWIKKSVEVWFNPGVLSSRGLPVDAYRDRLRQAVEVWNEENVSDIRLFYAGDTTATSGIGQVVVNHIDWSGCSMGVLATGDNIGGSEPLCDNRTERVDIRIYNTCFAQFYPTKPYKTTPGDGFSSYEGVLAHELGHAAFNLGHTTTTSSIMVPSGSSYHDQMLLYASDQECIVSEEGTTPYDQVTVRTTNDGTSWSTNSVPSSYLLSTYGPSLHQGAIGAPLRLGGHNGVWKYLWPASGQHGGTWTSWTAPANAGVANVESWVSIAHSTFGETVVVWLDNCVNSSGCPIKWAWTNTSDGSSWNTGTLSGGTRMRPVVAYARAQDKFVVVHIGNDNKLYTAHVSAASGSSWTGWTGSTVSSPLRYSGGLVFSNEGSGLLTVAIDPDYTSSSARSGQINQVAVEWNSTAYVLGTSGLQAAHTSAPNSFRTQRHFDAARRMGSSTQRTMMVWRDQGCSAGRGLMYSAYKDSLSDTVSFNGALSSGRCLYSSLTVAAEATSGVFVAGGVQP